MEGQGKITLHEEGGPRLYALTPDMQACNISRFPIFGAQIKRFSQFGDQL